MREIKKIAELAKLYIDECNTEKVERDMEAIISLAEGITEFETEAADNEFDGAASFEDLRNDTPQKSFARTEMLSNAENTEGEFICVPGSF